MKKRIEESCESESRELGRGWIFTVIAPNCFDFKKIFFCFASRVGTTTRPWSWLFFLGVSQYLFREKQPVSTWIILQLSFDINIINIYKSHKWKLYTMLILSKDNSGTSSVKCVCITVGFKICEDLGRKLFPRSYYLPGKVLDNPQER